MTDHQKRLIGLVRPYLSDVYVQAQLETADRPIGWSVSVRVPAPFSAGFMAPMTLNIHVMKLPEGLRFRVEDPTFWYQKGRTPAKFRRLLPAVA